MQKILENIDEKLQSDLYRTLKVLGIILVVAGHCAIMYTANGVFEPQVGSSALAWFAICVYQFHMPVFFMVSGAVFCLCLEKGKYGEFLPFLKNKALRLIVPYLIFGLLYVGPVLYFCGILSGNYLHFGFSGILLSQNSRHLWYLYTLFFIFIVLWPLRLIYRSRYFPLFLIASFIISSISTNISFGIIGYFQLGNVLFYQFFFLIGMFLYKYFQQIVTFSLRRKYVLIFPVLFFVGMFFYKPNIVASMFYTLCGMLAMIWLSVWLSRCCPWLLQTKLFRLIDENIFGIYLFHPMIIYLIYYATLSYAVNSFLLSSMAFLISFAISVLLTRSCRVLKIGFLIGEYGRGRYHG